MLRKISTRITSNELPQTNYLVSNCLISNCLRLVWIARQYCRYHSQVGMLHTAKRTQCNVWSTSGDWAQLPQVCRSILRSLVFTSVNSIAFEQRSYKFLAHHLPPSEKTFSTGSSIALRLFEVRELSEFEPSRTHSHCKLKSILSSNSNF